jgi:hypothetical protein
MIVDRFGISNGGGAPRPLTSTQVCEGHPPSTRPGLRARALAARVTRDELPDDEGLKGEDDPGATADVLHGSGCYVGELVKVAPGAERDGHA